MLTARPVADVEDLLWVHGQPVGRAVHLRLFLRVALALPGDQDTALAEKWGGQLGKGREAAYRSGGNRVIGLPLRAAGKLLRAGVDDVCVGDPGRVDGAPDELTLATDRLDQIKLGIRLGDRQHKARKPSSRANISDPTRTGQLTHLEPSEAVLNMDPPRTLRRSNGADRSPLLCQQGEHRLELLSLRRGESGRAGTSCTFSLPVHGRQPKTVPPKKLSGSPTGLSLLGNQRSDDHAAPRLVPFAVGLNAGAIFEVFVHNPPFLSAHRIHLNSDVALQRLLGGTVRSRGEHITPSLAVARGIEHHPFAVTQAPKGGLKAEQLQRVDRLAAFADQQPKVILAGNDGLDPLIVLPNLNLTIKVKLVQDPLHKLPNPLSRLLRPFRLATHAQHLMPAGEGDGGRVLLSEDPM